MFDPDDGDAARMDLTDRGEQRLGLGLGQSASDLVEKQEPRSHGKRLGQFELLHVQERQLSGGRFRAAREADAPQHGVAFAFGAVQGHPPAVSRRNEHILEDAHMGEGLRDLIRAADANTTAVPRLHRSDVAAVKQDTAAAWRQDASDHIEQRALSRPVRTYDAEHIAHFDRQIEALDNFQPTKRA